MQYVVIVRLNVMGVWKRHSKCTCACTHIDIMRLRPVTLPLNTQVQSPPKSSTDNRCPEVTLYTQVTDRQTDRQTDPTTVPSLRMRAEGNEVQTLGGL